MPRQLVCYSCETMDRLPDYDGDPQYDMTLIEMINRHLQRADNPEPDAHRSNVYKIDEKDAALIDAESEIQRKMREAGVFIRESRDELKLDALKCFNRHDRPKGGCIDWEDDSKIIGRKIGVAQEDRQYLCHLCPVASHVAFKERQKAGAYNVQAHEKALM